jgi:hypothetical protein
MRLVVHDEIACDSAALDMATSDNDIISADLDRPNAPSSDADAAGCANGSDVHIPACTTLPTHPDALKKDGVLTSVELNSVEYPMKS